MTSNYQNQNPCLDSCNCNCGTRICLDEQLINQREEWKEKFYCLQKQTTKDIGLLKEKIYMECSSLMVMFLIISLQQAEFNKKEKQHSDALNKKNIDIQELTSRIIKLQTAFKVSQKQKQVLKSKLAEDEQRYNQKLQQLSELKQKHVKQLNNAHEQNLSQTGILKLKITQQHNDVVKKLQTQNEHLKHKVKQFQKKYQAIIPEVQKLKGLLSKKTAELEGLEQQMQKTNQSKDKQIQLQKKKIQELTQNHAPCFPKFSQLNEKIASLENELSKAKIIKREVKVEPVYVDRPVQVQRVVEKIIEVERIVKQYIEPDFDYKKHEEDNKKLRTELQSIIHELRQFQSRYHQLAQQHEQSIQQYDSNIEKYKAQRQGLVKRIHEQDDELQKIYHMIEKQQSQRQCQSSNPERIVVQVNKDGTFNKRVEKIDIEERVNVQSTLSNIRAPKDSTSVNQISKKQLNNQNRKTVTIANKKK